jgi:type II restriction enzyme
MKKSISNKSIKVQNLINEALEILSLVGIPLSDKTERAKERMAMCLLAVANISVNWQQAKQDTNLKSRDIIKFVNENFEENISSGSYDDIRRKDLKLLVLANLITNSGISKGSATNDPTRGYALHRDFMNLILTYKTKKWSKALENFNRNRLNLAEILARKRNLKKIPIKLPNGKPLNLSLGAHNVLQKAIIEEFLSRFGNDCEILYIGDTANKILHIEIEKLKKLNFFELSHEKLPDIIAYSKAKNWLYLIEAVHSSGAMSETRVLELKNMLKECKADLIFVTAFLTKEILKKWILEIAWETEVWTADNPDHLVHFNGHKFLGTYKES